MGWYSGLGGQGRGLLAGHTHCRSISCCSRRILLDSIASRFCIRSSCRCSSRCRNSASRSRSVMNSSRPSWGEKRRLAQSPGNLEVHCQSLRAKIWVAFSSPWPPMSGIVAPALSDPSFWLGRNPPQLLSELQGRRPLGLSHECVAEIRGLSSWAAGQGSRGPHQLVLDLQLQLRRRWSGCGYSSARSRPVGTGR